ncbi:hypothetical protein QE152_g30269 [Popillia japonica]|uniref:Uncharacterized protein n=1 Tax=Popillia japonica TaxID=7064 RepID=A0AAW1JFH1_POPJA
MCDERAVVSEAPNIEMHSQQHRNPSLMMDARTGGPPCRCVSTANIDPRTCDGGSIRTIYTETLELDPI